MSKMLSNALGGNKKNGSTSSSNSKNKKREFIARVENERMKMVLKHPTFKENPVKAVLTHLAAQLETADQAGAVDILSVLQQARVVSSLADLSAYDLLDHVTTMARLSAGIESDELFARQLRRKFLHES